MIVFAGSFHGRTHLAMAMTTSKTGYRAGHAPLPAGIFVAPFPDPLADDEAAEVERALRGLDHLLATMTAPAETAAMILEPVLGEGGYMPAPAAFIEGVVERCRTHGDPVHRRRGADRASAAPARCSPSTTTASSPTSSAWPRASLPASRSPPSARAASSTTAGRPGSHGGTYGGNPIGCAAALATIDVLTAPGFLDNVRAARRAAASTGCGELQRLDDGFRQVRGLGLMVASVFDDPARVAAIAAHCRQRGPADPDERRHRTARRCGGCRRSS